MAQSSQPNGDVTVIDEPSPPDRWESEEESGIAQEATEPVRQRIWDRVEPVGTLVTRVAELMAKRVSDEEVAYDPDSQTLAVGRRDAPAPPRSDYELGLAAASYQTVVVFNPLAFGLVLVALLPAFLTVPVVLASLATTMAGIKCVSDVDAIELDSGREVRNWKRRRTEGEA